MDKNKANRIKRGQITEDDLLPFVKCNCNELLNLLNNKNPQKRTIATNLLKKYKNEEVVKRLIAKFKDEKALYVRLAISQTLASFEELAIDYLIDLLGVIGSNQEKHLPTKYFNKSSFPLPRDLAARTLMQCGKIATPFLVDRLNKIENQKDIFQIEQALDAIGAIAYKYEDYRALNSIVNLSQNLDNLDGIIDCSVNICKWKIIRSLSGFKENIIALNLIFSILTDFNSYPYILEAIRSIGQIGISNNNSKDFLLNFDNFINDIDVNMSNSNSINSNSINSNSINSNSINFNFNFNNNSNSNNNNNNNNNNNIDIKYNEEIKKALEIAIKQLNIK
ncbi:MAG: HEAT repeat domain-containing protein [Methanobrevibacter sp.]|jgi:hypothetical protein|nr:HEAT repeat domain-containing protein [Candidatus Methanoflexus mossambicus]